MSCNHWYDAVRILPMIFFLPQIYKPSKTEKKGEKSPTQAHSVKLFTNTLQKCEGYLKKAKVKNHSQI